MTPFAVAHLAIIGLAILLFIAAKPHHYRSPRDEGFDAFAWGLVFASSTLSIARLFS